MKSNTIMATRGDSLAGKKEGYVRIKLNESKENKAKGFYLLMTNGNTSSDAKDEFVIERKFITLLKRNNIDYEELPLNK